MTNTICQCDKGTLVFGGKNSYHSQGKCSLNFACCAIQIDKHRVYTFDKNITLLVKSKNSFKKLAKTPKTFFRKISLFNYANFSSEKMRFDSSIKNFDFQGRGDRSKKKNNDKSNTLMHIEFLDRQIEDGSKKYVEKKCQGT